MYWPDSKFTSSRRLSKYAGAALLVGSVGLNALLYTMLQGRANRMPPELPRTCVQSATELTRQLLDSSYISYARNTSDILTGGQMTPQVIRSLQERGLLPRSQQEVKATERTLEEERHVSAVRIDSVKADDRLTAQDYLPVDVTGVVATHSAAGTERKPFHLRYLFGVTGTAPHGPAGHPDYRPIVTALQDLAQ